MSGFVQGELMIFLIIKEVEVAEHLTTRGESLDAVKKGFGVGLHGDISNDIIELIWSL